METPTSVTPKQNIAEWRGWAGTPLERVPMPYTFTVAAIAMLIVTEQLWEATQTKIVTSPRSLAILRPWMVLPLLTIYMLWIWRTLRRRTLHTLIVLRPAVHTADEDYDTIARHMLRTRRGTYLGIAAITLIVVVLLFAGLHRSMPAYDDVYMPKENVFIAAAIIVSYTLFGWIGLSLSYDALMHAAGLSQLARRPLALNALDPSNILDFGRLSLWHSTALAGIILILVLALGPPQTVGIFVLIITLGGSLLTLILPLWGVHRQIVEAKENALQKINGQLGEVQTAIMEASKLSGDTLDDLANRVDKLVQLRSHILKAPNWPFRDTAAIARALTATSSPLIYLVLAALIERYIIPLFVK